MPIPPQEDAKAKMVGAETRKEPTNKLLRKMTHPQSESYRFNSRPKQTESEV